MAGNRTELALSMIARAVGDVETGMAHSCANIDEALQMRVNDLQNRLEDRQRGNTEAIKLDGLRNSVSPLLDAVDKSTYDKRRYAELVALNVKTHYGYACVALRKLLDGLKEVVIDNRAATRASSPVLLLRPHPLGGIKPPDPAEVVSAIREKMRKDGITKPPSVDTIGAAIDAICMENDAFKRENAINNAFDYENVELDISDSAKVVTLKGEPVDVVTRVLAEDWEASGIESIMSSNVVARPVEFSVGWRPQDWSFPVENVWGKNGVTLETLTSVLTRSVIPCVELANFLLCMCTHLRCIIRSVGEILFGDDTGVASTHFGDEVLSDWQTWLRLYNKLEWFMMVCRFFIFVHSRKDKFTENVDDTCVSSTLAATLESVPPWLLVDEWVTKTLMSWPSFSPDERRDDTFSTDEVSVGKLLSLAVRTSPGCIDPVTGTVNNEQHAVTYRINIDSAVFCFKTLLGHALDEEDHGVKMLVSRTDGSKYRTKDTLASSPPPPPPPPPSNSIPYSLGIVPESIGYTTDEDCDTQSCSFLSNPTYYVRRMWNMENCTSSNTQFKQENLAMVANVMARMAPVLFPSPSTQARDICEVWSSLKILPCCHAPSTIKEVWEQSIFGGEYAKNVHGLSDAAQLLASHAEVAAVSMAKEICQKRKALKERIENAATNIERFSNVVTKPIHNAHLACSLNAERALWTTAVWKNVTSLVLTQLSAFPE